MPWLVGTALIHSLAVTEKRGVFKSWTVLLAIAAFSLSLLGTFLVRSGVLTSVHAFASDPERGVFILIFLLFVVGGSLTLFALRAPVVKSQVGFNLWSRETLLLGNNLVLVVAASMILLGTLYPLVLDALTGAKLSVGPPYFNALFIPLMALLMVVMAVGVLVRWKDTPVKWLVGMLGPVLLGSVALAVVAGIAYGDFNWGSRHRRQDPAQGPDQGPAEPDPQLLGHAAGAPGHRGLRPGRGVVEPEQRRARSAPGAG
jgi:cytochrome c-type biogenesis protein CcmF